MAYFLLLALVLTVSFISLLPKSSESPKSQALASLTAGFVFLAIGFAAQLILGFHLDNGSALLFYWARETLVLAWFGHALLLLLFGSKPQLRWLTYALVLGSLFSLVLVGTTQVTKAEDWFQPARPIYAQIGDLLATNRPTRWGAGLLNAYGATGLFGGAVFLFSSLVRKKLKRSWLVPFLFAAGAIALLLPLALPPKESSAWFYLIELAGPVAIYFGFANLMATYLKTTKKPKRERTR
jgi:hypothetical protein